MPPDRERGAALLTVLLLVAVVSVLSATALERLRLATRIAGNTVSTEDARGFVYAAETLATTRLDALLAGNRDRVTLAGGWSDRPLPLPLPGGGVAVARVTDGGNCFNLNGLVSEAAPGTYVANPNGITQFARLMRLLGVPTAAAEQVAESAADWIDTDQSPEPAGAEDSRYLAMDPAYRTAGTLMADVSELRAVAGVTPDLYAQLRPWLCALPVAGPSSLNVDTMQPEQAPLLAMVAGDTLGVDRARQALLARPADGFASGADFWRQSSLTGVNPEAPGQAGVTSRWFALAVTVDRGGSALTSRSTIDARRSPSRVVARQWGEPS